jgi:type II secretory pathway pseudopilin PulG
MPRRGFSIIELLVIIAILLLLAAFLLPAVGKVRFAASRAQSQNNLRQLALAVHNFHDSMGRMPPAIGKSNNVDGTAHFFILPYIEQAALFQKAAGEPWKNEIFAIVIPVYVDPNDSSAPEKLYQGWLATTNYAANWLAFRSGDKSFINIVDGTSNTAMFATRYQMCNGTPTAWGYSEIHPWAPIFAFYSTAKFQLSPTQEQCDATLPQSIGNAINVGICDGSVRSLSPAISPRTWHLLCDPADGQPLDNDFN